MEADMRTHSKDHDGHSPIAILTEMAIEGTSSLVEAQRALLNLAQQENNIVFNGVKERVANFAPGVAMTDLIRRSVDTLIDLQQELLTTASKQTMELVDSTKAGKGTRAEHLMDFAREGVESFTRAQKRFLEVMAQEAAKATSGKHAHEIKPAKKTELAQLAREAGEAFIDAQKRLLDVIGQQMNVNLELTTRSMEMISPSQLLPVANITGEEVKKFFEMEKSLITSVMKERKPKPSGRAKRPRVKPPKEVVV
jgi:polyhydroxyalkanoate synthesis regulator protein